MSGFLRGFCFHSTYPPHAILPVFTIPLFIHLRMRPGLLAVSLSHAAFTRRKETSPAPCPSSDHSQCLFQKWRHHLPSDHTSQIHWTCCSFWSPSTSLRIRWRRAMYQTPPKSPRLKVFSLLVLCVPRQSGGRLSRQSLGGGVRGLPVNIRFRLSLRKERKGPAGIVHWLSSPAPGSGAGSPAHVSLAKAGQVTMAHLRGGGESCRSPRGEMECLWTSSFVSTTSVKEWGQIPRVLYFLMTRVSYTIILDLHHQ